MGVLTTEELFGKKEEEKEIEKFNEIEFQRTYKEMATKMGLSLDPDDPKHFYDYRALYRETGKLEPDEAEHFPSKYKLEGHPRKILTTEELFGEKQEFLKKAPEEKENWWDRFKKIFEAKPIEQIAKAQVSYNISQKTGVPIEEVHKNLDKVTKDLGIRGIPTSEEFLTAMFAFPVTAALISNPITAGIGVTKFLALTEAENFAISKLKKWEYKFGAGVGLKELLPEETNQLTRDIVDVADFIGKGLVIAKTDKGLMKIWKNFTQKISTEYTMPKNIYISAKKVKSIFQTGKKISPEESQLITDLGLNASQYKSAIKKGIDIEIPASKISTITDRPYWAKIKGLFNVKPVTETVVTRGGKVSPAKLMIEGKAKVPEVPIKVPKVPEVKPVVKPEIPTVKTKEEIYAEKYGIPSEKVKITKIPKVESKVLGERYVGKAYRTETYIPEHGAEIIGKMKTAQEKLNYDASTTGNPIFKEAGKLAEKLGIDLNKVPIKEMAWVAPKFETAEKYDGAKEFKLPEDTIILAKDSEGGFLVLKNTDKYIRKVEKVTIEETKKEAEAISKLIEAGERVEGIPEPTKEDLEFIEKGFKTLSKEEFVAKVKAEIPPEEVVSPEEIKSMVEYEKDMISQLSTGREKMRVPIGTKTEWKEALGKGKYMQIFRDDRNLPTTDEVASGLGISENELREQIIERISYKPEKLISPEGLVTGYAGTMFIPSMAEVQNIGTKLASIVSIEAPFIKAGAKETGFQVKNYYGNIGLSHQQGLKLINDMNRFNIKPVTVTESDFKASGELDYTDITYLSERPGYFVKLSPEERKLASPAKKAYKDFTEMWFKKVNEIGWLEEPFPKSLITRNNRKIGNMKASLPRLKTVEARVKVLAEIKKLQEQNDRIKKQKIQFVSIPAKAILARADTDPAMHSKIMSILPHWGRTTVTVKDLVDAKIITRKEADIRAIIGEYSDRMGRKYALGKIFENAEKEGLIKSAAEKPDWPTARIYIKGQHVSIPQLRGKRLDPFFSDVITDFFSRDQVGMGGVFGIVKMMQFHNPLFMPMYDVQQSAAAGMIRTPKAPLYIYRGIKDSLLKTDNWAKGYENGLFSKPFVIPYDKWEYQFSEAMKDNKMGEFLKKAALPTNWIPMLYTASWHTAWKLDETVRLMTFNMFQDQGMSDRDAGQLAALYHSDYASVPPRTRKALNKVFFTPTFKITMGKLYLNMLESSIKVVTKGKSATQKEKNLAKGALTALAILMGRKLYMQYKGFKEEELFRKYVKMTETDEGLKEDVVTFSDPFNIPFRYLGRVRGAFKPQTTNVAEKMLQIVKWDLHPIHRVAIDVVDNYNWNVYNQYDDSKDIAKDIAIYITGEFVAITKGLLESAKEGEIKTDAFKALQKDFGKFEAIILKPFVFNYLREPMAKRKTWAINKLRNDFRSMMLRSPSKDPKENYRRLQNFNKRLQEVMKDFQ